MPAVNILPGDPRGFAHPLSPAPRIFPKHLCVCVCVGGGGGGGQDLDQLKFFQELIKIYSVFLFLVNVFKRLLRTAGKTFVFIHNKLHYILSPETSKLNQLKSNNIVLEANATKQCV